MELIFRIFTFIATILIAFGAYVTKASAEVESASSPLSISNIKNLSLKKISEEKSITTNPKESDPQAKSIRQAWLECRPYSL